MVASGSIAILGGGKMGEILLRGMLSSASHTSADVVVTDQREEQLSHLARTYGVRTTRLNSDAVRSGSTVLLCVKPQDVQALLSEIRSEMTKEHLLISIAAGVPTSAILGHLPQGVPVVRAMPNAPARVGEAMTAICAGAGASEAHLKLAEQILASVGRVVRVPENAMDAVTALSGSGPAYFALIAEAMIDAAVAVGLERAMATDLVIQTMAGTALLLRDERMHPVALREAVTSPAGTTAAGLRELENGRVRGAILGAIEAAVSRSRELGGELKSG